MLRMLSVKRSKRQEITTYIFFLYVHKIYLENYLRDMAHHKPAELTEQTAPPYANPATPLKSITERQTLGALKRKCPNTRSFLRKKVKGGDRNSNHA